MKEAGTGDSSQHYDGDYAKSYLERTLQAFYTINKSKVLANIANKFGTHSVLDLGSNIHGSIKTEGSLRLQMDQKGIGYTGVDLSPKYFDQEFLAAQGIPREKIYSQSNGVVGDILQSPIKSDSAEMITCSDVLEHVSDPTYALKEIFRILKSDGVALIILPSLYKLDMASFNFVEEKRQSSHLSKTTVDEWVRACKESGFLIDIENSMSIGIISGLSYLIWMDERFVPARSDLSGLETYSPESNLHREAKSIFSKYDELIDSEVRADGLEPILLESLQKGDIKKVFKILEDVAFIIVSDQAERKILSNFFSEALFIQYPLERVSVIQNIFKNTEFPKFFLGNSVLLVLKKKNS